MFALPQGLSALLFREMSYRLSRYLLTVCEFCARSFQSGSAPLLSGPVVSLLSGRFGSFSGSALRSRKCLPVVSLLRILFRGGNFQTLKIQFCQWFSLGSNLRLNTIYRHLLSFNLHFRSYSCPPTKILKKFSFWPFPKPQRLYLWCQS